MATADIFKAAESVYVTLDCLLSDQEVVRAVLMALVAMDKAELLVDPKTLKMMRVREPTLDIPYESNEELAS